MYNKVIVMGRITKDIELKTTPQGVTVTSFTVAVDRPYTAKGQEKQTDFFNCVAWRSTAEFIAHYFGKGRMIHFDGELQNRSYTDKNGDKKTVTEIIVSSVQFTGEKPISQQTQQAPREEPQEQASGDNYPF